MAKTADGVEFALGMSLYKLHEDSFDPILSRFVVHETSQETHELEDIEIDFYRGKPVTVISRKGGAGGTNVDGWYSSKEAAVNAAIKIHLRVIKDEYHIIQELTKLKLRERRKEKG